MAGLVTHVCGYREWGPARVARRDLPVPTITVVLAFDHGIDVVNAAGRHHTHHRFAGGVATRAAITRHAGIQEGLQLDLTPAGARVLLDASPEQLADQTVDLDRLGGMTVSGLLDHVAEETTWPARLAALERALAPAAPSTPAARTPVVHAWDVLRRRRLIRFVQDRPAPPA